ncbi:MAG: hypothetical protein EZS28_020512 [Streblomastix strix]|uniref:Cyclin N-terminal domain-containing protein n=1 Tax=Streblomastix strix TaxID=222440 RepID=A0A5J4VN58_9EUKA|nr:MAG: hypothetical protein EZS28_020512 [Streblomastix strix]
MSKIWNNNKRLITIENIQQLVIGSFLIAHKYTGDHTYKNKYWAQALGISIETINSWESDILKTVNFEIFVDSEVYYEIEDIFRNRCDNEVKLSMGCITN